MPDTPSSICSSVAARVKPCTHVPAVTQLGLGTGPMFLGVPKQLEVLSRHFQSYSNSASDSSDAPGMSCPSITTMGLRMRRGSSTMSFSSSSSLSAAKSRPSFFTVGLLTANAFLARLPPNRVRSSSSVKGSAKKSRSVNDTSAWERPSLTFRQVDHFFHQ